MAREYFAKALEVEESTGTDGRRTARASYMSNLAAVSRAAGDVDLARDQYCTALDHLRGMIPDSNEAVETALSREEASLFRDSGDTWTSGYTIGGEGVAAPSPKLLGEGGVLNVAASILNNLGLLLKSIGRLHAARRCYVRAISLGTVALGAHSPAIALRVRNLGAVLLQLGYRDLAVERLSRAHGACVLGCGADHPETIMCAEWLQAATETVDLLPEAHAHARVGSDDEADTLPEAAEWFCERLRCGVLEPTGSRVYPGRSAPSRRSIRRRSAWRTRRYPRRSTRRRRRTTRRRRGWDPRGLGRRSCPLATGKKPHWKAGRGLIRWSRPGEDMLSPYAAPVTSRELKRVGNAETSPVWRAVALEHEAIVSGKSSMPRGQDYISAYLRQAPGYANLITPFQEMPSDLLMPYASFRGYGAPLKSGAARRGKGSPGGIGSPRGLWTSKGRQSRGRRRGRGP